MKKIEVTFHLNSGKEIGHLEHADSLQEVKNRIKSSLVQYDSIELAEDLVVLTKHVEYFILSEKED